MHKMKRLVVGVAFVAMLALTLVSSGSQAYAGSGKGNGHASTPSTGAPTNTSGGLFEALGITWE